MLRTYEALVDLLVGVVHAAAETVENGLEATTAVAKLEDEVLVGASEFHIMLLIFGKDGSGVFARQI